MQVTRRKVGEYVYIDRPSLVKVERIGTKAVVLVVSDPDPTKVKRRSKRTEPAAPQ